MYRFAGGSEQLTLFAALRAQSFCRNQYAIGSAKTSISGPSRGVESHSSKTNTPRTITEPTSNPNKARSQNTGANPLGSRCVVFMVSNTTNRNRKYNNPPITYNAPTIHPDSSLCSRRGPAKRTDAGLAPPSTRSRPCNKTRKLQVMAAESNKKAARETGKIWLDSKSASP